MSAGDYEHPTDKKVTTKKKIYGELNEKLFGSGNS